MIRVLPPAKPEAYFCSPIKEARNLVQFNRRYKTTARPKFLTCEFLAQFRCAECPFVSRNANYVRVGPGKVGALGANKKKMYEQFPRLPNNLINSPAFVTELMGVTFYCHLDRLIDELFAEEPEVRKRLKEISDEITIDEVAHVGQRRNFIGPLGMIVSKALVKPFFTLFFKEYPEIERLFDVDQMNKDGRLRL